MMSLAKWFGLGAVGLVVALSATSEEKPAAPAAAAATPTPSGEVAKEAAAPAAEKGPNSCLTDIEVIRELKARRDALEAKEKQLDTLREELKQREALTVEELKRLEAARAELLKIEGTQKSDAEQKVTKLVETLELMPPKASAKVITELEDSLAVATMSRISNLKLAKIMAAMDPKRSSALSQLMAKGKKAKS